MNLFSKKITKEEFHEGINKLEKNLNLINERLTLMNNQLNNTLYNRYNSGTPLSSTPVFSSNNPMTSNNQGFINTQETLSYSTNTYPTSTNIASGYSAQPLTNPLQEDIARVSATIQYPISFISTAISTEEKSNKNVKVEENIRLDPSRQKENQRMLEI